MIGWGDLMRNKIEKTKRWVRRVVVVVVFDPHRQRQRHGRRRRRRRRCHRRQCDALIKRCQKFSRADWFQQFYPEKKKNFPEKNQRRRRRRHQFVGSPNRHETRTIFRVTEMAVLVPRLPTSRPLTERFHGRRCAATASSTSSDPGNCFLIVW